MCEYCNSQKLIIGRLVQQQDNSNLSAKIIGNKLKISSFVLKIFYSEELETNINFCPMCGIKLK